ncbi:hypothetical protein [uncultured Sphingomonas sp.]|uniref:hypothetical protein n=1 Tax=uncultured Sphingomonas sp. TaxID=158754 RepID=UPI0025ED62AA|nr:hypothetical protein [uncultured Sphingomonas sp.]
MAGIPVGAAVVLEPLVRLIERADYGGGECFVAIELSLHALTWRETNPERRIAAPTAWWAAA